MHAQGVKQSVCLSVVVVVVVVGTKITRSRVLGICASSLTSYTSGNFQYPLTAPLRPPSPQINVPSFQSHYNYYLILTGACAPRSVTY